ncbi:PilW family protein [Neisseria wadsworthii]|uniref:PilW family protein n=1 Tax=Neisseria wadsworthii TaxID=607711 RepID=UPI00131DE7E7|nr:hypothetical protein [Neisseria wadsworthii]
MKNKFYIGRYVKKIKGFSIIEFMVASLLSMIILIAVGAGYFAARKVNDVAIARLNAQQDIRNASNMVVHDARMAGGFGCFNINNLDPARNIRVVADEESVTNIHKLVGFQFSDTVELSEGVKSIAESRFTEATGINNFTAQSDAVVFQYSEGSPTVTAVGANTITINAASDVATNNLVNNSFVAISTCNTLGRYSITGKNQNVLTLNQALHNSITSPAVRHEVSLAKYVVNIYVVGTPTGRERGFYRIRLGVDGKWEEPQLLLPGIDRMDILYGYVHQCQGIDPEVDTDVVAASAPETFSFTNKPEATRSDRPLASIRLVLNRNNIAAEGQLMSNATSREAAGNVHIYNIDANIRGGNRCADR